MLDKEFKKLWEIRFLKIFDLEKEGFLFYRRLLKHYERLFEGTLAKEVIREIMQDELKHVRLARELVRLVRGKGLAAAEEKRHGH